MANCDPTPISNFVLGMGSLGAAPIALISKPGWIHGSDRQINWKKFALKKCL